MKWVDRRPEVDPLDGRATHDPRTSGLSDADEAALEWALRLGEAWSVDVVAVTAGPADAEPMVRDALAAGAASAVRLDLPLDASSEEVAAAIAGALPGDVDVVVCGAWSLDRGSGSVPAYVAARRRCRQALGLVGLTVVAGTERTVLAERRLEGGRRERLRVAAPAVLSVEGGLRVRRASLPAVLRARDALIDVIPVARGGARAPDRVSTSPFRPRARVLPGPDPSLDPRQRIAALTGAFVDREPPRLVRLDPAAAADELLEQLRAWGYT